METKKNQKADIRNLRIIFLEFGMIVALGLVLAAFQWGVNDRSGVKFDYQIPTELPIELPPITTVDKPKPPEPPKPPKALEIELIKNNDQQPLDTVDFSSEATQEQPVVTIPLEVEVELADTTYEIYLVDVMPKFKGGDEALVRFIGSKTVFPKEAIENRIGGRVYVSFVINETGQVTQIALLRGADNILNQEALRVVSSMPDWIPGQKRGKPVKVKYQVPINFKIN